MRAKLHTARCPFGRRQNLAAADNRWQPINHRKLGTQGLGALLDLPAAWLHNREWRIPDSVCTQTLWQAIEMHGLGAIAGSVALRGTLHGGAEMSAMAVNRYWSNALHYHNALQAARALYDAAVQQHIPMTFVKGIQLATNVYDDPALRPFNDIDALVADEQAAERILQAAGGSCLPKPARLAVHTRVMEPDRVHASLQNWPIECIVCMPPPCSDPFQDLLRMHQPAWNIPACLDKGLPGPIPGFHIAFLLLHLLRHMGSRLIWWLDLAVFFRKHPAAWDDVEMYLDEVDARDWFQAVCQTCRQLLDPDFPPHTLLTGSWRTRLLSGIVHPPSIAGSRYATTNTTAWRAWLYRRWLPVYSLFLPHTSPGRGAHYASRRLLTAMESRNDGYLERCLRYAIQATLPALSVLPHPRPLPLMLEGNPLHQLSVRSI